jgi:hypothetical protein
MEIPDIYIHVWFFVVCWLSGYVINERFIYTETVIKNLTRKVMELECTVRDAQQIIEYKSQMTDKFKRYMLKKMREFRRPTAAAARSLT